MQLHVYYMSKALHFNYTNGSNSNVTTRYYIKFLNPSCSSNNIKHFHLSGCYCFACVCVCMFRGYLETELWTTNLEISFRLWFWIVCQFCCPDLHCVECLLCVLLFVTASFLVVSVWLSWSLWSLFCCALLCKDTGRATSTSMPWKNLHIFIN